MEGMRIEYHRYDIIEAEIKMTTPSGSVQKKKRPYVIVGNEKGTTTAPTVIAMPYDVGDIRSCRYYLRITLHNNQ